MSAQPERQPLTNENLAAKALENLAAHRYLRETEEQRWERSIGTAVALGNSLRKVAEVAGVSHMTVKRIAASLKLDTELDTEKGKIEP